MSLQTRLAELVAAIGADIKAIPNARTGWGPPTNAIGKTGEYYVDMSNLDVYGPKAVRAPAKVTGLTGQLHPNPTVESNTTNWSISASAGGGTSFNERTTDHPQDGLWAYHGRIHRIDASSAVNQVNTQGATGATGLSAVDNTKVYSFSLRAYTRENSMTGGGRVRVYWYKADNSPSSIDTNTLGSVTTPFVVGETTEHILENVTPPADATQCRVTLYVGANANPGNNAWEGDVDSVVMVQAAEVPKWGAATGKLFASVAPSLVTSLPGSPVDGQEIYYNADGTNNIIWHLRYRSAVSKWEFVGGSSLYAEDLANRASINNTPNYGALATAVQVTAPLAGVYEVEYSVSATTSGTNTGSFNDVAVGSTVGSDQNASMFYMNSSTFPRGSTHKKRRVTCAAGDVIALVHKAAVTSITYHARTLSIKPVAVS